MRPSHKKEPATARTRPSGRTADARMTPASLPDALITLQDKFAEYCDISAFVCHGLSTSLQQADWLDGEIATGARRCTDWLQARRAELKSDIRHLHALYNTEHARPADHRKSDPIPENRSKEARHA